MTVSALIAVATCCLALSAPGASARTYSVYSCVGPSGESLPNDAWSKQAPSLSVLALFSFSGSCPSLSVTAVGPVLTAGQNAGWGFQAPAGTTISGYEIRRSVSVNFLSVGSKPAISAGLERTTADGSSYWGECEAVVSACSVATSGTQSAGLVASGLQLGVECVEPSGCGSLGVNVAQAKLVSARVDVSDPSPPKVTVTGGTLSGATATSGSRTLGASIGDVGGGVKSYWLEIDGAKGSVIELGGSCAGTFTYRVPCPLTQSANFAVNLESAGPGEHSAVVYASDAAGNVGRSQSVRFGSSRPPLTNEGGPPAAATVVSTRTRSLEGPGGRALVIRGSVATSAGAPIAGVALEVTATSAVGGSADEFLGAAKTDRKGHFKFRVTPKGARVVTFTYRSDADPLAAASASTLVRQRLALSASASKSRLTRGQSLTLSGRLAGTAGAAAGVSVEIDVRNGATWQKVGVVTALANGRFAWRHRFTRVTRPTLFTFRAVVRASATWPWKSKASRGVAVLVNG